MPISPSDRTLGDLLVGRRLITPAQLDEAVALAERWNVRLGDALLSRNWIDPRLYYEAYAQNFDLPFVDLLDEPPDRALLSADDVDTYAHRLTMPWRRHDGRLAIATAEPGPETLLFARRRWGTAIEFVVVSKFDIIFAIQTAFADSLSHRAVHELAELDPDMSAQTVFTPGQITFGYVLLSLTLLGLRVRAHRYAHRPQHRHGHVLSRQFHLQGHPGLGRRPPVRRHRRDHRDRGARVARRGPAGLHGSRSDVPRSRQCCRGWRTRCAHSTIRSASSTSRSCSKPAIPETIEAARTLGLEGVFEIILVPPSQPQTKPKACNFALRFARGEYLVIYDAEDRPEPDQLRKVVATFRRSPRNTACLQCRLNYYNAAENWLTRMFTLDYALWFDQVLPGLERLNMPIPLGGTSNHFRIDGAARAARLGSVQRHRGRRSRHPHRPEGLSRRRRRFDDLRGGELPDAATGSASARAGSRATCRRCWSIRGGRYSSSATPVRSAFSASSSSSAARC